MSSLAMAGIVYTDAYTHTAQSEARGSHALTQVVRSDALPAHSSRVQAVTLLSLAASATVAETAQQ
ncbi:hypothetical protein [Rugamonas sp.]|uniref:hypothetical protein n=1 Tax=Rugamonas sp. TaxID=1926287 RepID=UPI0025E6879E|nr:hypothetical protein [Rugamonas sp.]